MATCGRATFTRSGAKKSTSNDKMVQAVVTSGDKTNQTITCKNPNAANGTTEDSGVSDDTDNKSESGTYTVDAEDLKVEEARKKIDEVFGVQELRSKEQFPSNSEIHNKRSDSPFWLQTVTKQLTTQQASSQQLVQPSHLKPESPINQLPQSRLNEISSL